MLTKILSLAKVWPSSSEPSSQQGLNLWAFVFISVSPSFSKNPAKSVYGEFRTLDI